MREVLNWKKFALLCLAAFFKLFARVLLTLFPFRRQHRSYRRLLLNQPSVSNLFELLWLLLLFLWARCLGFRRCRLKTTPRHQILGGVFGHHFSGLVLRLLSLLLFLFLLA